MNRNLSSLILLKTHWVGLYIWSTFRNREDSKRVYELDDSYDPSDKLAAIQKSMEFGDQIPLGVLYQEHKPTFHQKNFVLKNGVPLIDQRNDPSVVKSLIKEFI